MGEANVTGSFATRLTRLLRRVARIAVALLITYTVASVIWRSYGSNKFELSIDRNGIQVYTLKAPGETLRMVKAVTRVRSSMAGLVMLLTETCGEYEFEPPAPTRGIGRIATTLFPKQGCIDDGEFYRVDEHLQYGRFRLPFPFPFRAREFVVRSDLHQDPRTGKLWIEYAAAPEQIPPNDCCVRMTHMNNFVQLTPLGNGLVGIDYVLNMDAGGYLPDLVASVMYPKFIFGVLRGLQPRLAQGKYQTAKNDLIVER